MKKEYLQLPVEELLEVEEFIAWMRYGKHQKEWESFLKENPEFIENVNKARKVMELLNDRHDHLTEQDLLKIWKNIKHFDQQIKRGKVHLLMHTVMRYAAMVILLLSIATAGFWVFNRNQKLYVYATTADSGKNSKSKLHLSNGTTVDLETDNSKIAINGDERVIIDNEKVIDLTKSTIQDVSAMNEVLIPYGKKMHLILGDGTRVWLNAGSKMAFPSKFTGKKREVFLDGEGYFEVAHNQSQPFFVHTGDIAIKVLGTRFNISAYESDKLIETVLIEGSVAISIKSALGFLKKETILVPSQRASYDRKDHSMALKFESDVEFTYAWTEGWFKFHRQSLNDVLNKLQRYYDVQFIYESDFQVSDLITGKLDLKDSITQVMVALDDVANLQYRIIGNKIYIGSKTNK